MDEWGADALLNTTIRPRGGGCADCGCGPCAGPVAAATPESDADGRDHRGVGRRRRRHRPAGTKDGGVYPVGGGFGQNFAGGKIFFTPDTGAHIMAGAILEKYESLGGPADGDLGFPTIDEGAGTGARTAATPRSAPPTSRSSSGRPTPAPTSCAVPINAAWDKLGGSAGALGVPTEDETYKRRRRLAEVHRWRAVLDTGPKEFTTVPPDLAGQLAGLTIPDDATSAINAARRAAGGPLGPLGAEQGAAVSRSGRTARGRTSPAARSSTARPRARTWSAARSSPSTSPSAARRAIWASPPATRPTAG